MAELAAVDPARAAEYAFGSYLDGDGRAAPSFERAVDAWAVASDIPVDEGLLIRARSVWDLTRAERAAAEAQRVAQAAERRARLEPVKWSTWEFSGEIRFGSLVTAEDFDARDFTDLGKIAHTGAGTEEGLDNLALNSARHAHLAGGNQGVSYAFVVNSQWTVDLLVYTRSVCRRG
ncbi:hypothetical protein ACLQ24_29740 [Micromonospora sp. DT4]|uniref:hypothetical protein n=1 Tax=Micromonospora sp. DT4 TaxID=3393438 RepID=UPI003CF1D083